MPAGHLPVCSYLAIPVKSRSGEVLGGLFFGHPEENVFTAEAETAVTALAAQAAIAIDNSALHSALQKELERANQGQEANRRLALVVQSSDDAIVSKDLNGTIMSWNAGAQRIFGYAAEEVIGKSITILIPIDRRNEEVEILSKIRRAERIDHYETVRRTKTGRLVDVSLSVSPIKGEDGSVIGASKIARDISERRRVELRQNALYELVARVNRAAEWTEIYDAALNALGRSQNADRCSILLTTKPEPCDSSPGMGFRTGIGARKKATSRGGRESGPALDLHRRCGKRRVGAGFARGGQTGRNPLLRLCALGF